MSSDANKDALYERVVDLALSDDAFAVKYVAMIRKAMLEHEPGTEAHDHLVMMMDQFYEAKKAS